MLNRVKSGALTRSLLFVMAYGLCAGCVIAEIPPASARTIGASDDVLPGYQPLVREAGQLSLYQRKYLWQNSYLPIRISALGRFLAKCDIYLIDSDGVEHSLEPDSFQWLSTSSARADYIATGRFQNFELNVQGSIEYDGLIDVRISFLPGESTTFRELGFRATIQNDPHSVALGFSADNIRQQKDRRDLLQIPHRGPFLHAVDISDGDRSFWWFADNNRDWIEDPDIPTTTITEKNGNIVLRQRLFVTAKPIKSKRSIRFGILATPVKAIASKQRAERATSKYHSEYEEQLGSRFKLWWPSAFAYDAFPYTDYSVNNPQLLTLQDRAGYPGVKKNRALVRAGRELYDYHWLPYASAHVLSMFDPTLVKHRREWEILPRKVFRDGLLPYSNRFDKPVLTHNGPGYSDYLLSRFDAVIDELDLEGIYFDHGPPHDSNNPLNGGWVDDKGKLRPSLDIFALRSFLKRLRTLFVQKGKQGYIFIHVSNREIIPAYTFAHAIVDGEQYRARIDQGNYLELTPLQEFRARFAGNQYGVANYWLPTDWTNYESEGHWRNTAWANSDDQRIAYRRVMGLALLHDIPLWQIGDHDAERKRLITMLDRLPVADAEFTGYWNPIRFVTTDNENMKISQYRVGSKILSVVTNVTNEPQAATLTFADEDAECRIDRVDRRLSDPSATLRKSSRQHSVRLDAFDFTIVSLRLSPGCSLGNHD